MDFPEFDFGTLRYRQHEGTGVYTESYECVKEDAYSAGVEAFLLAGFSVKEEYNMGPMKFSALEKAGDATFISYFKDEEVLFLVTEPNTGYFAYSDKKREVKTTASLTQLDLSDFGLSYLIRLPDGRFIVIDGGFIYDVDSDNLLKRMKERAGGEDIVIAAWIMTHAHQDHYRCFISFMEKYSDEVTVEKFIYNFPDASEDEYEPWPALKNDDEVAFLKRFYALVEKTGAPVYRAHTGQIYNVGDAKIEMLGTPDDNENVPVRGFNYVSLVMKMTLAGQVILFAGDRQFQHSMLVDLWKDYLKCDIMQIPHHGFHGGTMRFYEYADARVYFAPTLHLDCYEKILKNYDFNLHVWFDREPDDYITGSFGDVTVDLPYFPAPERKLQLKKYLEEHNVKREPTVITSGI